MDIEIETIEDRIQSAFLTSFDNFITPRIELAVRSIKESSWEDATFVAANSERAERIGLTTFFENVSHRNNCRNTPAKAAVNPCLKKRLIQIQQTLKSPISY